MTVQADTSISTALLHPGDSDGSDDLRQRSGRSERRARGCRDGEVDARDLAPADARGAGELLEDVEGRAVGRRRGEPVVSASPPEREQQVADLAAPLLGRYAAADHGECHPTGLALG